MNGTVVQSLILADLHRHRMFILFTIVSGGLALGLLQAGGELPFILGATWFFTGLIVFGCMLPSSNIINEKKKQTQPFLMSLPISVVQYAVAKTISTVGMFLLPWLALILAAVLFIAGRAALPDGSIPVVIAIAGLILVGFCLITGVSIISESEGASVAAMIAANSSYGIGWYLMVRNPAIRAGMKSPEIVWNKEILTVLGFEFGVIVLILGLTFLLQSRKRDFI
jgi:ABC-2 type transport system permease protein